MARSTEGAVDEGAEVEVAEDVKHLAQHDGHVGVAPCGVRVAPVEVPVEAGPRARTPGEMVRKCRRGALGRISLLLGYCPGTKSSSDGGQRPTTWPQTPSPSPADEGRETGMGMRWPEQEDTTRCHDRYFKRDDPPALRTPNRGGEEG